MHEPRGLVPTYVNVATAVRGHIALLIAWRYAKRKQLPHRVYSTVISGVSTLVDSEGSPLKPVCYRPTNYPQLPINYSDPLHPVEMPALDILYPAADLLRRETDCSEIGSAQDVERSKSPDAALIGGLVAGFVSLVMLAIMFSVLWKTRSKGSGPEGMPISCATPYMQRIDSVSTSNVGTRTPRELRRSGTLSSTYSAAVVDGNGLVNSSKELEKEESRE